MKLFIKDFLLEETLNSGQFFLYEKIDDFYFIVNGKKVFKVKQDNNFLYFKGIEKAELVKFFSLDEDISHLRELKDDEFLEKAVKEYYGLRLIKADLWQTVISFVCSSASNIEKIKFNLKIICELFGERIEFEGYEFYTFPKIGKINDLDKLRLAKTGFRAKYILSINNELKNENLLEYISDLPYREAKQSLQKLAGIGPKVSDCICLFGLGKREVFPIDTWVRQIIEKVYLKRKAKNLQEIEKFIEKKFKKNKGIIQQYLFHYARKNLKN